MVRERKWSGVLIKGEVYESVVGGEELGLVFVEFEDAELMATGKVVYLSNQLVVCVFGIVEVGNGDELGGGIKPLMEGELAVIFSVKVISGQEIGTGAIA